MTQENDLRDPPDALRWQLRALRQDHAPQADLWPSIARRLTAPEGAILPPQGVLPARSWPWTPRGRLPVALAASVLVAVGTLGLLRFGAPSPGETAMTRSQQGPANRPDRDALHLPVGTPEAPLALAEAEGLRLHYEGAIRELETRPGAAAPQPALQTLDHSAQLILAALRRSPDSTWLLDQLRRTYQRRLDLMRLPLA